MFVLSGRPYVQIKSLAIPMCLSWVGSDKTKAGLAVSNGLKSVQLLAQNYKQRNLMNKHSGK